MPTGTYTYTPDPGFFGPDQFTYSVCDTAGLCDTATVYITVIPPAPEANDDINNTLVNIPVDGNILTNDDDEGLPVTLNTTPVDGPDNGTIVINPDGSYTYTPDPGLCRRRHGIVTRSAMRRCCAIRHTCILR